MKKIYYLLIFVTATSGAQIINFPDVNFKWRLLEASATNNIALDINGDSMKIDVNVDNEIDVSKALTDLLDRKSGIYFIKMISAFGADIKKNVKN